MTVIFNVFVLDAGSTLLLFKIEPEFWECSKNIYGVFEYALPEGELAEVKKTRKSRKY